MLVSQRRTSGRPLCMDSERSAEAGGLIAFGLEHRRSDRRAAAYVDKILKGTKPSESPVEQPRVRPGHQHETARALGLRSRRRCWRVRIRSSSHRPARSCGPRGPVASPRCSPPGAAGGGSVTIGYLGETSPSRSAPGRRLPRGLCQLGTWRNRPSSSRTEGPRDSDERRRSSRGELVRSSRYHPHGRHPVLWRPASDPIDPHRHSDAGTRWRPASWRASRSQAGT